MKKTIVLSGLALCFAACAGEPGAVSSQEQAASTSTYQYYRCNTTGWNLSDANRLRQSSDMYLRELFVDVAAPITESCRLTYTNELNGWGTTNGDYGLLHTADGGIINIPGGDQLVYPSNGYATQFRVAYPSAGRYKVVFNDRDGSFVISKASALESWNPMPNGGTISTIARGFSIGCGGVSNGPRSAVVGYLSGDVYRTADANTDSPSWTRLNDWTDPAGGKHSLPGTPVATVAVDPCNERSVYVGFAGDKQGLKFFHTSTLSTWEQVNVPAEVLSLSLVPNATAHLIAVVKGGGVIESGDGGSTWTSNVLPIPGAPVLNSGERISAIGPLYNDGKSAVVGTTSGRLFLSFDMASGSWTPLTGGSFPSTTVTRVTSDPRTSPPAIYATFMGLNDAVWRSGNGGQAWVSIHNPAIPKDRYSPASLYGLLGVSLHPRNTAVLFVNGTGDYRAGRSVDFGQTWSWAQ